MGHNIISGLVEFWPLSEQSDVRRGVHGGLHLTDNNSVTGGDGVGSLASNFARVNTEFLSRASNASLQPTGDCTFCAWVNLATLSAPPHVIVAKYDALGNQKSYRLLHSGGFQWLVSPNVDGTGEVTVTATTFGAATVGVWNFIVASHDTVSDLLRISINAGVEDTAAFSAGMAQSSSDVRFGNWQNSAEWATDGLIQRVGLWNRLLSADERTYLYNGGRGRDYPFI